MAKTKQRTENEGLDLIENPEAIVSKTEEFFNDKKNQNIVFGIGGVILLVVLGFLGFKYYTNTRNQEAQEEMFQAVYYFESDSLGRALNGDGNSYGFLEIIDSYSGTAAANLSNFYAGATYMKLGDYESAIRYLSDFSSSDQLIKARAFSLTGDAYMELDDFDNAIGSYQSAVGHKPNKEFTPLYMTKLALAYEKQGNLQEALNTYSSLVEKYYDATLVQEAKKQKARLEGLIAE